MNGTPPRAVLREIKTFLSRIGIENPLEANVIFETALGCPASETGVRGGVSREERETVRRMLEKRAAGYPLQYIAGSWPFLDFELFVGEGVFIPRPDTECVALEAIECIRGLPAPVVYDLCSGSGCIAIAIKRACKGASVTAVEYDAQAFEYLEKNIAAAGAGVIAVRANVLGYETTLPASSADLIVCNPPYVSVEEYQSLMPELYHEPRGALTDGSDGLTFYRYIAGAYRSKLKPGGMLIFETGDSMISAVSSIVREAGFISRGTRVDQFGNERALLAER